MTSETAAAMVEYLAREYCEQLRPWPNPGDSGYEQAEEIKNILVNHIMSFTSQVRDKLRCREWGEPLTRMQAQGSGGADNGYLAPLTHQVAKSK